MHLGCITNATTNGSTPYYWGLVPIQPFTLIRQMLTIEAHGHAVHSGYQNLVTPWRLSVDYNAFLCLLVEIAQRPFIVDALTAEFSADGLSSDKLEFATSRCAWLNSSDMACPSVVECSCQKAWHSLSKAHSSVNGKRLTTYSGNPVTLINLLFTRFRHFEMILALMLTTLSQLWKDGELGTLLIPKFRSYAQRFSDILLMKLLHTLSSAESELVNKWTACELSVQMVPQQVTGDVNILEKLDEAKTQCFLMLGVFLGRTFIYMGLSSDPSVAMLVSNKKSQLVAA
ncbi:hypothetical protein Tco_0529559 [Tanacetum coccineum]